MTEQQTPTATERTYMPPAVRQFSVFLDNRVGRLYDLLEVFEDHPEVQICSLNVVDASDYAVIRMIPNNSAIARALLRNRSIPNSETDLLVVELEPNHTLTRMCLYLLGAELNIHFAYPLMLRRDGKPTIALAVDDYILAGQILRTKMFTLLGEADLPHPGWNTGAD